MTLEDRIRRCIASHPDWDDRRVASAIRGTSKAVATVRSGGNLPPWAPAPEEKRSVIDKPKQDSISISLDQVRKRFDIVTAIRHELEKVRAGVLIPEREMALRAAGKDYTRFRRAVENNAEEFRRNRVKLKLDPDGGEATWYWGSAEDVAEAIRLRDE